MSVEIWLDIDSTKRWHSLTEQEYELGPDGYLAWFIFPDSTGRRLLYLTQNATLAEGYYDAETRALIVPYKIHKDDNTRFRISHAVATRSETGRRPVDSGETVGGARRTGGPASRTSPMTPDAPGYHHSWLTRWRRRCGSPPGPGTSRTFVPATRAKAGFCIATAASVARSCALEKC